MKHKEQRQLKRLLLIRTLRQVLIVSFYVVTALTITDKAVAFVGRQSFVKRHCIKLMWSGVKSETGKGAKKAWKGTVWFIKGVIF